MFPKLVEQLVLFFSVARWFLIASVIGIIVGAATAFFLGILNGSSTWAAQWPLYFLLLPLGMFLSSWLVTALCPEAEGHGTEQVIEAVHQRAGRIKPSVVPIKLLATLTTLCTGGAAGKEGPCAQIGAGICSYLADLFKFNDTDRKKLVICGISAGFSAVFGTPVSGSIFAVEVLAIGQIQYSVLFPSFVAGIMAYQISNLMGTAYFSEVIRISRGFNELLFFEVVLIGISCGLCSFLFIEIISLMHKLSGKIRIWKPLKGVVGGVLMLLTVFISERYLGLGLPRIESLLHGQAVADWYDAPAKMYATAVTLGFGGSGGIITPIFFIGSSFGSYLATLFHRPSDLLAALGLVGVVSGCANTPIAASMMAVELFGTPIGPYAAIVSIISFVISGHRSVYPSQIVGMSKSDALSVDLGKDLQHTAPAEFHP